MRPTPHRSRLHSRVQGDNVLGAARTIAQLTKDVTDMLNVPFAAQAASLVVSLLEVAKAVKDNDDARVRLATSAGSFLVRLRPFLENADTLSETLMKLLGDFISSLLSLSDELAELRKRGWMKKVWKKDHTTTRLLDGERVLRDAYDTLMMSIALDTNITVQMSNAQSAHQGDHLRLGIRTIDLGTGDEIDDIRQYSQTEIRRTGHFKSAPAFFSDLETGEVCSTRQRVIIKIVENKTERDQKAKLWYRLWHPNLPHLVGCSSDRSRKHFILFDNNLSYFARHTVEIRSLAAFVSEMLRTQDAYSIIDTLVHFVNDAISAIRHMQEVLHLDEKETVFIAAVAKYTIDCDGRIIANPPLQDFSALTGSVSRSVYENLFPSYGANGNSMRRYYANLDSLPPHTSGSLTDGLVHDQRDKWILIDNIRSQIRSLGNGVETVQQCVKQERRWAWIDYSVNMRPGDVGVLQPGKKEDYAFQPIGNCMGNKSPPYGRDEVKFEEVNKEPMMWKLDRFPDKWIFTHQSYQRLAETFGHLERFLQFCTPEPCEVDELVFITICRRFCLYEYIFNSASLGAEKSAVVYAELRDAGTDILHFRPCPPRSCSRFCGHSIDSNIHIKKYYEYMRIEYATIQVKKCTTNIKSKNSQDIAVHKFREYEDTIMQDTHSIGRDTPWREWP